MNTRIKPTAERTALIFGCTKEQAKELFAKNAKDLSECADKAAKNGGIYRGSTEDALRSASVDYLEASK